MAGSPGFRPLSNAELLDALTERVGDRVHVSVGTIGGGGIATLGRAGMLRAGNEPFRFHIDGGQEIGSVPTLDLRGATGDRAQDVPGIGIRLGDSGRLHIATESELADLE